MANVSLDKPAELDLKNEIYDFILRLGESSSKTSGEFDIQEIRSKCRSFAKYSNSFSVTDKKMFYDGVTSVGALALHDEKVAFDFIKIASEAGHIEKAIDIAYFFLQKGKPLIGFKLVSHYRANSNGALSNEIKSLTNKLLESGHIPTKYTITMLKVRKYRFLGTMMALIVVPYFLSKLFLFRIFMRDDPRCDMGPYYW